METDRPESKILKILLTNISIEQTVSSLAKELDMSRTGTWKTLKKMEEEKTITLLPLGTGKTSVLKIALNWENPLTEKRLALILTEDAIRNRKWMADFEELENKTDFLIIYGSAIHSPKEANDIDILGVANKNKLLSIGESVQKAQKTQAKKIHSINFTKAEFRQELNKPNKAFTEAIKKGIILFGQEKFIKFMRCLKGK